MTTEEFNRKYEEYLEPGHYGLDISNKEFIDWLDTKFQEYIKIPGFSYTQIKTKFNMGRFYCTGLPKEEITLVEQTIQQLLWNLSK